MLSAKQEAALQYVVRIDGEELPAPDFKVFRTRPEAEHRFRIARVLVSRDQLSSAALYEVDDDDVRAAKKAVAEGTKDKIRLLEYAPEKLPDIDLKELGLI